MNEKDIIGKTFETTTFRGKATRIIDGMKDKEAFNQKYVVLVSKEGFTHSVPLKYFGKTAVIKEAK